MNTNFTVIGLTRLGIKAECTVQLQRRTLLPVKIVYIVKAVSMQGSMQKVRLFVGNTVEEILQSQNCGKFT